MLRSEPRFSYGRSVGGGGEEAMGGWMVKALIRVSAGHQKIVADNKGIHSYRITRVDIPVNEQSKTTSETQASTSKDENNLESTAVVQACAIWF